MGVVSTGRLGRPAGLGNFDFSDFRVGLIDVSELKCDLSDCFAFVYLFLC